MLLRHLLYMFVFAHPQVPFRELGPSLLEWKSKWIWQIMHISLIFFILKDHQKPHVDTRHKGTLISVFSLIH